MYIILYRCITNQRYQTWRTFHYTAIIPKRIQYNINMYNKFARCVEYPVTICRRKYTDVYYVIYTRYASSFSSSEVMTTVSLNSKAASLLMKMGSRRIKLLLLRPYYNEWWHYNTNKFHDDSDVYITHILRTNE